MDLIVKFVNFNDTDVITTSGELCKYTSGTFIYNSANSDYYYFGYGDGNSETIFDPSWRDVYVYDEKGNETSFSVGSKYHYKDARLTDGCYYFYLCDSDHALSSYPFDD